jgi:phytoene dehydrogenase-like protein
MPDATYDVVIVGGGNKALAVGMWLARYGGMSVGIFERRHEIGGGWAAEESPAPGFLANTHAQMIFLWMHYLAAQRDFPEFDAELDMYVMNNSGIFRDTGKCLGIYTVKHDPTQERTAREIARFSERDAEMWLKGWDLREVFLKNAILMINSPAADFELRTMERLPELMAAFQEKGIELDPIYTMYSPLQANKEFWESKELQCILVRQALSGGADVTLPGRGTLPLQYAAILPYMCFHVGGTHQAAHAAHKILLADGAKIWTHCEVDKVIIENGTATGIRLTDGTEIGARKLVISTLSPQQLCFDLIGREHLSSQILRRIELLESKHTTIGWYNWALQEPPEYTAAEFNPDINYAYWLGLHQVTDPDTIARETYWRRLGKMAPLEDQNPVVWCHSRIDPRYAPPGKAQASHENFMPPATALTEREWLQLKKQHSEDMISLWQTFAPNMTWDNVIGCAPDTPYDCCRLKNMGPEGNWNVLDPVPHQMGKFRPIPELSDYRTPIKNLYATGVGWPFGCGASVGEGYSCYKIIAEDLGLGKPWLEPGKEEPDSLYEVMKTLEKKLQEKAKTKVGVK